MKTLTCLQCALPARAVGTISGIEIRECDAAHRTGVVIETPETHRRLNDEKSRVRVLSADDDAPRAVKKRVRHSRAVNE